MVGQEQDDLGGSFNPSESFVGTLTSLNIWNEVLSDAQLTALTGNCSVQMFGNVVAWADFQLGISGKLQKVETEFCSGKFSCSSL